MIGSVDRPYELLSAWMQEAEETEPRVPDAVQLATADARGRPSVRTVLLRRWGPEEGLVFFTSYQSRKGRELADNPYAALCWHLKGLKRQLLAEGPVRPLPDADSDAYFASRPRGSQLGAWASQQSRPLVSRQQLLRDVEQQAERFRGAPVARPPTWGGYQLLPTRFEFWLDAADRLHERIALTREGGGWVSQRLYP